MPSLIPPTLHPVFVHAAVGFLLLVPLTATVAAARRGHWAGRALPWIYTLAIAATLATVASGLLEEERAEAQAEEPLTEALIETHQVLGISTLAVFGALWIWTLVTRVAIAATGPPWILVGVLWLALALLVITGWYGGALVFEQGVGVLP